MQGESELYHTARHTAREASCGVPKGDDLCIINVNLYVRAFTSLTDVVGGCRPGEQPGRHGWRPGRCSQETSDYDGRGLRLGEE